MKSHQPHPGACGPDCPVDEEQDERKVWEIRAEQLARQSWGYFSEFLQAVDNNNELDIAQISRVYRMAFKHGYKHANDEWHTWDKGKTVETPCS